MRTVGIICEYNPLHGGHAYLLHHARRAETVVCLMSGNFVQRGEAAVLPPVSRAAMAIKAGADLVLELPFPYAAASAAYFASAGVHVLHAVGCDTVLCGSETADEGVVLSAAQCLESEAFSKRFGERSPETGDARAHFAALGATLSSNDILAVEYARAILKKKTGQHLALLKREGAGYSELSFGGGYPSAASLRRLMAEGKDVTLLLPHEVQDAFREALAAGGGAADVARLGGAMLSHLRCNPVLAGRDIADCGGGLYAHLVAAAAKATDYRSLCEAAATKRYTNGRIRRALLYVLAGVTPADLKAPPAFVRLLAANEKGRAYLSRVRKTATVPVVTKPSDVAALGDVAARARHLSSISDGLYALCITKPTTPAEVMLIPPYMG